MSLFKTKVKVSRELSGARKFRPWKDYEIGDVLIAYYEGKTQPDQFGKINTVVKVVEAQFADGTGEEYENKRLVLNSCGILDKNIEGVKVGECIQLEFGGLATMEKGKYKNKEAYSMNIQVVELEDDTSEASL